MKEEVEDLVERYENRIKVLDQLINERKFKSVRLIVKKHVYMNIVRELKLLLEDYENTD